jgi:hypothetical protein
MSAPARSVLAFGLYLAGGAAVLLFAPELAAGVLGLPPGDGFWVRLNGMFFAILAYYCVRAAREEHTTFMAASVWPRSSTIVFMAAFVAMDLVGPVALAFGAVDALFAFWTARALRGDWRRARPAEGSVSR